MVSCLFMFISWHLLHDNSTITTHVIYKFQQRISWSKKIIILNLSIKNLGESSPLHFTHQVSPEHHRWERFLLIFVSSSFICPSSSKSINDTWWKLSPLHFTHRVSPEHYRWERFLFILFLHGTTLQLSVQHPYYWWILSPLHLTYRISPE